MFGHQDNNQDSNQNDTTDGMPMDTPLAEPLSPAISPTVGSPTASPDESMNTDFIVTDPAPSVAHPVAPDASPTPATDSPAVVTANTDDLLAIKQSALQQLSPLVSHLDQSPEEKFRTTMMMIQATDNHGLVQAAFDAASQISDEKARAQALLDVVNEINYFTQQQHEA